MRRFTTVLTLSLPLLAVSEAARAVGCKASVSISNMASGSPDGGGFDFSSTSYSGKASGPEIRFWGQGAYAKANSGSQTQTLEKSEWLVNPAAKFQLKDQPAGNFVLYSADWFGDKVAGCVLGVSERTVVEMSFADPAREGTAGHAGYYAIVSIPVKAGIFDADQVRGGSGAKGNVVPVVAIPAPVVSGAPKALGTGFAEVSVELPVAASYSEGGKDLPAALVKGYRLLFAEGTEPTSSDPAKYLPVRDPKATGKELGLVKAGKSTIAVPAGKSAWIVSQLVYEDPSPLYSQATSSHVAVAASAGDSTKPPAASGRRRTGSDTHR